MPHFERNPRYHTFTLDALLDWIVYCDRSALYMYVQHRQAKSARRVKDTRNIGQHYRREFWSAINELAARYQAVAIGARGVPASFLRLPFNRGAGCPRILARSELASEGRASLDFL